ncbi:hypothetical protein HLRTI_000425 [Halorhabdus tiamatea SARL4B]|uniref:Uncharacterized protein n=1 Tax=Halorhabdus tiamatea SARL4B TaxID=1033806 RepID=U2E588_9EURY|nr:hypothetical protein HLRTI_000425 [Halorhabdus tiamatea SARL4B]
MIINDIENKRVLVIGYIVAETALVRFFGVTSPTLQNQSFNLFPALDTESRH